MAISEMQKVRMAVHKSVSDEVMSSIQRMGCCHFIADQGDKPDERDVAALRSRLRKVDAMLSEAKFASRFLEGYASAKGMENPSMSMESLKNAASEESFKPTSEKLHSLEKRLADARAGLSRVEGLIAQIEPISALPCSLDFYSVGSDGLAGSLYSVPTVQVDALRSALSKKCGEMVDVYALPADGKNATQYISVIYPRGAAQEIQECAAHHQATRVDVPAGISNTASAELESLKKERDELKASEEKIIESITEAAPDALGATMTVQDYWTIQKNKLDTLLGGEQTEQIAIYSFWIPKERVAEFKKSTVQYEHLMDIKISDPEKGEMPPTTLHNKGLADPVEPLIEMYGTPTYGGFDPSAIVAPFFYMFFGICFGDAGYGLIIASLLIFIMVKKHLTGMAKKFIMIMILGNICAVIFGAISFSWFGDSITAFSFLSPIRGLQKLQLLDPMNDPMTMLAVSLALGFIHLMVGLVIAMYMNVKKGALFAAFADQGGWMIFLVGLVLVGLTMGGMVSFIPAESAIALAAAGAIILVATQGREKKGIFGKLFSGVMSLYGVTSYLGDVLSYSRLLALGLGSAAVGMVINLLANLVSGVPYVGVVLGVIVFIVGHLFGIAANILGAFVHSLRLQYVEFFGKFHEASGEEFHPLRLSTQFVKISKQA